MKKLMPFIALSLPVQAETLWSDFSLSYLNGSHYQVGDSDRQVATFEYATGTSWGGAFLFIDRLHSDNGDKETYGEFSPKFTLHEFAGTGWVKRLSAAATIEVGEEFTHYLYGAGIGLKPAGFNYLNVDLYRRNNDSGKDSWQTTITWAVPFKLASSQWLFDGFLDWSSAIGEQGTAASMNWTSQLKWNLTPYLGLKSPLYLGMEYAYWNNKYGIQGVHERNANLLIKWHF
ncbi:outer membrane protein OmpK [Bowmanella denitrificans]|uniref:Outer membrane protein OmpK n=1 Tax=Bowmanella denitrificans TaxID=366582 RepID=A0ABN0XMP4_9ALTE